MGIYVEIVHSDLTIKYLDTSSKGMELTGIELNERFSDDIIPLYFCAGEVTPEEFTFKWPGLKEMHAFVARMWESNVRGEFVVFTAEELSLEKWVLHLNGIAYSVVVSKNNWETLFNAPSPSLEWKECDGERMVPITCWACPQCGSTVPPIIDEVMTPVLRATAYDEDRHLCVGKERGVQEVAAMYIKCLMCSFSAEIKPEGDNEGATYDLTKCDVIRKRVTK